jgi:hypothetical protein
VANSLTNKVQTVVVQHVNVGDGGEPWSPDRRKCGEKRRAQGTLPQGSDQKMRVNPMNRAGSWRVTGHSPRLRRAVARGTERDNPVGHQLWRTVGAA